MPSPVLGIDLGTTNSVVAYADAQRVRVLRGEAGRLVTPSTVSFLEDGTTLVGSAARDQRLLDVENTVFSVKRLIGRPFRSAEVRSAAERLPFKLAEGPTGGVVVRIRNETFSLPEISSFILRHLRGLAEDALGQPCQNAVITVPANFNELQRMATRDAGRIAGLNVLRILNEPTAAALAYGYRAQQQQRIAVYDFGGGTFDISILELSGDVIEVVATAGDTHLGGDDLDRALADRMNTAFQTQHGIDLRQHVQQNQRVTLAAEWLKCQLSEREVAEATIREVASVNGTPLDLTFRLSRSELYELCAPLIGRTFAICEEALKLARVRPSQLDGVILVGGQTRTPKVREMVSEYFGMDPKYSVDPDLAVAQGAALQGFALSGLPAGERRPTRTLAGPATAPPPPDDPFEDEPTRVATPRESADSSAPARRSDTPFDDQPTTISLRHSNAAATQLGEGRAGVPSIRPDGVPGSFASTIAGVGAPTQSERRAERDSEPVTVSSDEPVARGLELAEFPLVEGASDGDVEYLHPAFAQLDVDAEVLKLPGAKPPAAKTLAETPSAKAGMRPSRLPPGLRSSPPRPLPAAPEAASPLRAAELQQDPRRTLERRPAPDEPEILVEEPDEPELPAVLHAPPEAAEDPSTTLLERPRAKAKTRPPGAAVSEAAAALETEAASRSAGPQPTAAGTPRLANAAVAPEASAPAEAPAAPPPRAQASAAKPRPSADLGVPAPNPTTPVRPSDLLGGVPRASAAPARSAAAPASAAKPASTAARAMAASASAPAVPTRSAAPIAAPALQHLESQFPAPPGVAPLLLDVTPHTLCVETVGGFCEQIIERNAPIPTEQTRVFTTSRDNQVTVSVRVCQGESRRTDENQVLGQIDLLGLRQARRGEVSIAVTFVIDADGTLNVRAIDEATGYGQEIEVNLVGAIAAQDIERMQARQRR
jgi:molecular chaperone DnaK